MEDDEFHEERPLFEEGQLVKNEPVDPGMKKIQFPNVVVVTFNIYENIISWDQVIITFKKAYTLKTLKYMPTQIVKK